MPGTKQGGVLRCYMNLFALNGIPFEKQLERVTNAHFDGVQFAHWGTAAELNGCRGVGLRIAGSARINTPPESDAIGRRFKDDGYECGTLHVGWGLEDDSEAGALIESILNAADRWGVPLYVETHRATIFQDMWRTVQFVKRFPTLSINGDFSHWYAGQEMVYGGFETKFAFIKPVIDRVRFLHGRIASPGCIQVPYVPDAPYVAHFEQLWTASFRGFLNQASEGDAICFVPELLGPDIYYARTFGGVEESDRWQQALLLREVAQQCFASAKQD
jgi:hypothetical protein